MVDKLEENYLLVEVAVKVAAIERLLVKSNIITIDALHDEMKKVSKETVDYMSAKTLIQTNKN